MVAQFNKDGTYIRTYESIMEAVRVTGVHHSSIRFAMRHPNRKAGDCYWRMGDSNRINNEEILDHREMAISSFRQKMGTPVTQLDLNGNILASYSTKSLAAKITGISHKSISQNIIGLISNAGGFIWKPGNLLKFENTCFDYKLNDIEIDGRKIELSDCYKRDKTDRGNFSRGVKVTKFTPVGVPVACYNTLRSAAESVQRRNQTIAFAIPGKPRVIAGYIWRRV